MAREKALQFLFQHEVNPAETLAAGLRAFWEEQGPVVREDLARLKTLGEGDGLMGEVKPEGPGETGEVEETATIGFEGGDAPGVSVEGVREVAEGPTVEEAGMREFADGLVRGTLEHVVQIDEELSRVMINWSLHRLAAVDRNLLRMAVYELRYRDDIPPVVSINEAIDIARKFSTAESGKFVNGILDRIKGELNRPLREVVGGVKDTAV
jgi:N utilization substance protein B